MQFIYQQSVFPLYQFSAFSRLYGKGLLVNWCAWKREAWRDWKKHPGALMKTWTGKIELKKTHWYKIGLKWNETSWIWGDICRGIWSVSPEDKDYLLQNSDCVWIEEIRGVKNDQQKSPKTVRNNAKHCMTCKVLCRQQVSMALSQMNSENTRLLPTNGWNAGHRQ